MRPGSGPRAHFLPPPRRLAPNLSPGRRGARPGSRRTPERRCRRRRAHFDELAGKGQTNDQLVEAARAAARTKGSHSSAQYARIARRRGPNKAAVAVAHSTLAVVWHLLTTGALYQDPGADYFQRRHDPVAEAKRLTRRIEALGYEVVLHEKAA